MVTEFFPTGKDLRFTGGVEARNFFIAKNLANRHKLYVITSHLAKSPLKEKMLGFTVFRVGPSRNYSATTGDLISRIFFIISAIKFAKKLDIDIVEGSNFITHFIAGLIAKSKKIPCIAWYPDVWIGKWIKNAGIVGLFGEALERINLLLGFDTYITISRQTTKKLQKYVKSNIHYIPCGVDSAEFRQKTNKFKNPTIICISRLAKYKNIKTLVLAFAHLSRKMKNLRLIIIGTGPESESLATLADTLKISHKVKFFSNLSRRELIGLLKASQIFCLPSIVEGFGIATIEAAAAGIPYVNSNIPINREITKNGTGGFLVDPKSPLAFSQGISQLLTNTSLYKQKTNQSKELVNLYSWEKISRQTEKIYQSLS